MSSSDRNDTFYLSQFSLVSRSSFVVPFTNIIEDTHATAINMERSPSPRLKRGIQFFHPRRSEITIANVIEDINTTAINMGRSPSPCLKRGIEEVEDGNLTPPELVKRSKTEHVQENGNIADDKAITVKPRSILRHNSNYVASEVPPTPLDRLNIQENSEETPPTNRKSVHWDPNVDNDQTLWIKEKMMRRQRRAKELAEPNFSVTFTDEEWSDFVDNNDLAQALKSAPEEMINEIANHLVIEQSSTLRFITKRVQDESEDEVTRFTDSAALLCFRKELLLALEPYFGMQYILCGSCETLHRPCHCCSKIGYIPEPYPAKPCPSRFFVCKDRQWNALSLKPIDFAHTQKGMKSESRKLRHSLFNLFKLPRTTLYMGAEKTYRVIQLNEIFVVEERGLRLLHRKQDWFFGTGKDMKKLEIAVRQALWLEAPASLKPYPGVCRHFKRAGIHFNLLFFFASIPGPSKLYRCDECALEWQIDMVDIKTENSSGLALVFTVWRDLGRCLSPFDPRWTAHFEEYEGDEYKRDYFYLHDETGPNKGWREDEEPVNDWALGGIRKAFEMDQDWKLDVEACLTRKQLKLLTDLSDPKEF
jgi:hypothetical protein